MIRRRSTCQVFQHAPHLAHTKRDKAGKAEMVLGAGFHRRQSNYKQTRFGRRFLSFARGFASTPQGDRKTRRSSNGDLSERWIQLLDETLCLINVPFSRSQSRSFSVLRLSCSALPLARAISALTRPPL